MSETSAAPIDFYFDFISPFGYFASLRINALAAAHGRPVDWRSMLVGVTVLKVMGLKPMLDIPLRGAYLKHDAARYMRRHGIVLTRPIDRPPTSPLLAGRAFHWLRTHAPDRARAAAAALYAAYWMEDIALDDAERVAEIAGLGNAADRRGILDGLASGEAALLLRQEVDASIARGIFGSPSFLVDGELFFGVEKLELLDEWLEVGGW
ncbi:MAG TPA: DsbA family protein [Aliidongia sp.]|uniref:2-hydroxychromene-2-carboxylate isomerase n=1 Tax=Aliidongia sp. TaxID=1914230 RepID=UPI002DDD4F7D|nr:DsbA family protein [Aliidongia sp.]HEV2677552.1 DsbA family protein [Aliidongia sp.]